MKPIIRVLHVALQIVPFQGHLAQSELIPSLSTSQTICNICPDFQKVSIELCIGPVCNHVSVPPGSHAR